jgi:transposase
MKETLERLAADRDCILLDLERNTQAMKYAAQQAESHGLRAPTIARFLEVSKRTVYRWLRS